MSDYDAPAYHPDTKRLETARFMDDYYGPHCYGVKFPDGGIFRQPDVRQPAPFLIEEPTENPDAEHLQQPPRLHRNRPYGNDYDGGDFEEGILDMRIRNGQFTRATFPVDEAGIERALGLLVGQFHGMSVAAGWWQDSETGASLLDAPDVGEKIALIHTEISEAVQCHRKRQADSHLPTMPGVAVELADAIIRICDLAGALHLDLGAATAAKHSYNAERQDHSIEARAAIGGKAF